MRTDDWTYSIRSFTLNMSPRLGMTAITRSDSRNLSGRNLNQIDQIRLAAALKRRQPIDDYRDHLISRRSARQRLFRTRIAENVYEFTIHANSHRYSRRHNSNNTSAKRRSPLDRPFA